MCIYLVTERMIPDLPEVNDEKPVDFLLIENKWEIVDVKLGKDSIGKFRNDLNNLKEMRNKMKLKAAGLIIQKHTQKETKEVEEVETVEISTATPLKLNKPQTNRLIRSSNKLKQLNHVENPTNPISDQSVHVIKPTEWIDCISRESKRVFVKDNWIVARILLPPIAKDSIGLKRLP